MPICDLLPHVFKCEYYRTTYEKKQMSDIMYEL